MGYIKAPLRAAGGGQLGEGAFKGYMARESVAREKEKSGRADEYLGIAQEDLKIRQTASANKNEEFGWKREDREKENSIMSGMVDANKRGGYEGVIDFLKQVDPERALKFDQGKKRLDASIMSNDVMKSTSEFTKNKAMVESYGIMGKMGAAIFQAPEEEQAGMYQRVLPMLKKVNPDAPKTWNANAQNDMQLAMAQASPANQLFKANNDLVVNRSRIGKLNEDIERRQANGQTSENNGGLRSMLIERERLEINSQKATLTKTEQALKAAERDRDDQQKQLKYASQISNDIKKQSKPFTEFTDLSTKIEGSLTTLRNDPKNFPAKAMIGRAIAKMANGVGVLTQADVDELIKSDASYAQARKIANTIFSGTKDQISDKEMEGLTKLYKAMEASALSKQLSLESAHEDQINQYPGAIDINTVIMPSQAYKAFKSKMGIDRQTEQEGQQFLQSVPPKFQQKAQELLEAGHSLQDVQNALKEKLAQPAR